MTGPSIATEPIPIGGRYCYIKFYAAPRNPGDPSTIVGTLTLMPDEAVLVLDALIGPKGDKGESAPFWDPQWQSTITNPADLPQPSALTDADAGKAWYIGGYWHIWDGDNYQTLLGAIPGPPGPMPRITATAEGVPANATPYGSILVEYGGTDAEPHLHFKVPLIVGPKGDNSRISESLDFSGEPEDGQTILWNATTQRWEPGDASQQIVQWMTVPEGVFGPGGSFSAARTVVAAVMVPQKPWAHYAKIGGHLRWKRSGLFNSAQVSVEVRGLETGATGAPETGALFAKALYDPSTLDAETIAHIRAHLSDASDPSRAAAPDSAVGRISKGKAMTYYIILTRTGGFGNYVYSTTESHADIMLMPVS